MPATQDQEENLMKLAIIHLNEHGLLGEIGKSWGGLAIAGGGAITAWLDVVHGVLGIVATAVAIAAGWYSIKASKAAIAKSKSTEPRKTQPIV